MPQIENGRIVLDTDKKWFRCSLSNDDKCTQLRPTFFSANTHVRIAHVSKGVDASVLSLTDEEKATLEGVPLKRAEPETASSKSSVAAYDGAAGTGQAQPSLAELQAQSGSLKELLDDEDFGEEDDGVEGQFLVEPTVIRRAAPNRDFPVEIHFIHDVYRANGATDDIIQWITDIALEYFVMIGMKFEILNVPVEMRERYLIEKGLMVG